MNYFDLIYIKRIAELGSISKAAEDLYIAQPNLSRKLQAIEEEINEKIFVRSNTGITLTDKGREFLDAAENIIRECQLFENQFYNKEQTTTLSIISTRSSYVCSAIIAFANSELERGNSVDIKFEEAINQDVVRSVYYGVCDLGIIRPTSTNYSAYVDLITSYKCQYLELPRLKHVVLVHEEHPITSIRHIKLADLARYTEILYYDFENSMISANELATTNERVPVNVIRVADRGSLLDAVSRVKGAFMITTGTDREVLRKYRLVELPCDELTFYGCDIIIYKDQDLINPYAKRFINFVQDACPND